MNFFDFDFNTLRLDCFKTDRASILSEAQAIYNLYKLNPHNQRQELYERALSHVTRVEYGSGGYGVFRGYYCPSIHGPFTVGGSNRGKVLKRITQKSKISYEFCYEEDELIMVKHYEDPTLDFAQEEFICAEFIERRGDIEIGVTFPYNRGENDEWNEIEIVHICQYDREQLRNVRTFFCGKSEDGTGYGEEMNGFEYENEWLSYQGKQLKKVDYLNYFPSCDILTLDKVTFLFDEDGCPVQYYHRDETDMIYDVSKINQQYYRQMYMKK